MTSATEEVIRPKIRVVLERKGGKWRAHVPGLAFSDVVATSRSAALRGVRELVQERIESECLAESHPDSGAKPDNEVLPSGRWKRMPNGTYAWVGSALSDPEKFRKSMKKAFGAWKDFDAEAFLAEMRAARGAWDPAE